MNIQQIKYIYLLFILNTSILSGFLNENATSLFQGFEQETFEEFQSTCNDNELDVVATLTDYDFNVRYVVDKYDLNSSNIKYSYSLHQSIRAPPTSLQI